MRTIAILLTMLALVIAGYFYTYESQFRAMRSEIQKNRHLEITNSSQHRDVTLEDFHFAVRSSSGWEFHVAIVDGSSVRWPRDRAAGLLVKWGKGTGMDVINVSDSYWKTHGLPPVSDFSVFLENSDAILNTLSMHPPATKSFANFPIPDHPAHAFIFVTKKPGQ